MYRKKNSIYRVQYYLQFQASTGGLPYLKVDNCMVRPLQMAVLLLSVHPLLDQCLLHLSPTHMTDLPTYLPQGSATEDCSY